MELVRSEGLWPRGPTFGDLLIAAGKRGVRVRLLVWLQPTMSAMSSLYYTDFLNPKNLPGWTHDTYFFNYSIGQNEIDKIDAKQTIARHREAHLKQARTRGDDIALDDQIAIARKARAEYCRDWFCDAVESTAVSRTSSSPTAWPTRKRLNPASHRKSTNPTPSSGEA